MRALRFGPYLFGVVAIWLVSAMERPPIPEPLVFWNSDKLLHMIAYAILATLALFAAGAHRHGAIAAVLMSALYGGVDELHQSFVPGRSSSLLDLVADTLGALLAVTVWLSIKRRKRAQPS